jgi:hypothetical protein
LGDKFARSLMAPIPPPAILSLLQAGYPGDLVFRLKGNEVNGIRNCFGGAARAQSADPEFYALIGKWGDFKRLKISGGVSPHEKENIPNYCDRLYYRFICVSHCMLLFEST